MLLEKIVGGNKMRKTREKKTVRVCLRLDEKTYNDFRSYCRENGYYYSGRIKFLIAQELQRSTIDNMRGK